MAIVWGAYQNHLRLGIDISQSPASVGAGTYAVQLNVDVHAQMDGSSSQYVNNAWVNLSGWWSGSKQIAVNLGPGQSMLVHRQSVWVETNSWPTGYWFALDLAHWFGTTTQRRDWTVAARPEAVPNAPSALSVSRTSDTQHVLNWTRNSTYTAVAVQRRENDGPWSQIGRPSGNAASFTDTSTRADRKYEYRVQGINGGGTSGWSNTAVVYTSPGVPGAVSAARSGTGIVVSATGLPVYATAFDVMDGSTVVATSVALPWTHSSPSTSVAHTYKVRATRGSLVSDWSAASNTVNLLAAPYAPTMLAPNAAVKDVAAALVLSWQHNPADASGQTQFQMQWRAAGGSSWTVRTAVVSGTQSVTWANVASITGGVGLFEWQVRTKGQHADWSPWSATATFELIDAPGVAVLVPGPVFDRPSLSVSWSWSQAQGRPQSGWEVRLLDSDGVLVEEHSGSGASSSLALAARLEDRSSYTVRVRAATGDVWSAWASVAFTVGFVPPAPPVLFGEWQEAAGSVSVSTGAGARDTSAAVLNRALTPLPASSWTMTWGTGGAGTVTTAPVGVGGRNMRVAEWTAAGTGTRRMTVAYGATDVPTTVGETVPVSIDVALSTGGDAYIGIDWMNGGSLVSGQAGTSGPVSTDPLAPSRLTFNAGPAPSGTTAMRVYVALGGSSTAAGAKLYADRLMVGTGTYFDGNTGMIQTATGWKFTRWTGPVNASTSTTVTPPDTLTIDLARSIDNGQTWEPILVGADANTIIEDWESLSNGPTMYRVTGYADTGASSVSEITVNATSNAVWLSGGSGFATAARLPYNPDVKISAGRARSAQRYEGRSKPVAYAGAQLSRTVDVGSSVIDGDPECATIDRLQDIAWSATPVHLHRDPDGRRIYGVLSDVAMPREVAGIWQVSYQVEESDR